jgi:hypothetical protein
MNATFVRCSAVIGLLVAQGCAAARMGPAGGGADWPQILAQAEAAASERRYSDADRLLAAYAARNPGSQGATESAYWRGVLALEPANQDGSPLVAAALFETYGKAPGPLPHRLEADILRHVALKLQSFSPSAVASSATQPMSAAGSPSAASAADLKAKDTEIQRLKDELAKANDELERIKRRLTAPTKPQ